MVHWRYGSKLGYLNAGFDKFVESYEKLGIESVAFFFLGARNGGLNKDVVISLMIEKLENCNIPIEIIDIDTNISDPFFIEFRHKLLNSNLAEISERTSFEETKILPVFSALEQDSINSFDQLRLLKGINAQALVKMGRYIMD